MAYGNFGTIDELAKGFYSAMADLSDAELRACIDQTAELTNTNCWWVTFALGPAVRDFAKTLLYHRLRKAGRQVDADQVALIR